MTIKTKSGIEIELTNYQVDTLTWVFLNAPRDVLSDQDYNFLNDLATVFDNEYWRERQIKERGNKYEN